MIDWRVAVHGMVLGTTTTGFDRINGDGDGGGSGGGGGFQIIHFTVNSPTPNGRNRPESQLRSTLVHASYQLSTKHLEYVASFIALQHLVSCYVYLFLFYGAVSDSSQTSGSANPLLLNPFVVVSDDECRIVFCL